MRLDLRVTCIHWRQLHPCLYYAYSSFYVMAKINEKPVDDINKRDIAATETEAEKLAKTGNEAV